MALRTGTCPSCGSNEIYAKSGGLEGLLLDSKRVEAIGYVCVACGLTEQHVADRDALAKVVARAEKLGDWKRVG